MSSRSPSKCLSCAFPIGADGGVMAVVGHLRNMLHHVGYSIDRLLLQDAADGSVSMELDLRPSSKRPRHSPNDLCPEPPSKRLAVAGCRLCASSCCSTNSLCKANVCHHHNEEESHPELSSPDVPSEAPTADKSNMNAAPASRHHHHHHHHHPRHQHHHHHRQKRSTQPPEPPAEPPHRIEFQTAQDEEPHEPRFQSLTPSPDVSKHPPPTNSFLPSRRPSIPTSTPFPHSTPEPAKQIVRPQPSIDIDPPALREPPTGWTASTAPAGTAFESNRAPIPVDFPTPSPTLPIPSNPTIPPQRPSTLSEHPEEHIPVQPRNEPHPTDLKNSNQDKPDHSEKLAPPDPNVPLRPTPVLVCTPCTQSFPSELELRKHQYIIHKDEKIATRTPEGRFLCLMHSCTQSFVRRHVMERHFKTRHLMLRDFPCSSCDRVFADSSTREAHRSAVHEKRKPWRCDHCSSCFTQSSSLGKHRRRFHQETTTLSTPPKFGAKN